MARLSRLLLSSLAVLGVNAGSAVLDLIPSNFDDVVLKSGKPALVEFFAPWCGHCKNLAPVYEELAQNFEFAADKVVIGKVDADEHKELGRKFGVQGFPTLKWFDGKSDKPTDYSSGRDLESLSAFITEKTGIKPKGKQAPPSKVQLLTDDNFKTEIGGDKHALVAFTAPWCGHCKKLKPTWEVLAQDFAPESNVLVGQVDCEAPNAKALAQEQGVNSYPTIKYFPAGSKEGIPYEGGRSEQDLINFINDKASTFRAVGGGLNAQGGTVSALDAIVEKVLAAKEGIASGLEEIKAAATSEDSKFAQYYVRVSQKLSENAGYVKKELARLEGLLKKGGLAPEKRDDLTSRSNVLRKFSSLLNPEKSEL